MPDVQQFFDHVCVCQVAVKCKVTWITLPIVEVRQLKRARALQDADDAARGRGAAGRGVGRGRARAGRARGHGLHRKPLKKKALSKILGCLYNSVLSIMVSFFLAFLHVIQQWPSLGLWCIADGPFSLQSRCGARTFVGSHREEVLETFQFLSSR